MYKRMPLTQIRFILAAIHKGQSRGVGVAQGPKRILQELAKDSSFQKNKYPVVNPIKSIENLFAQHAALETECRNSQGCDIVIGGDHSLSIGSVSNTLKQYPGAKMIWIDAHADINTWQSSPSCNMHGMPVAGVLGLLDESPPLCSFNDILYLGLRDLDPFEKDFLCESQIKCLSSEDIIQDMKSSMTQINEFLSEKPPVHLSIDIDVLDPYYTPGTGTPVKKGLTPYMLHRLIDTVISSGNVVCVDLVEYNPELDDKDERTLHECVTILKRILEGKRLERYEFET